jgi:hypothetical protein
VVGESDLWCLQNEDANPNLVVIDLEEGIQKLYMNARIEAADLTQIDTRKSGLD